MLRANWVRDVLGDCCVGCARPGAPLCRSCAMIAMRADDTRPPACTATVAAAWEYTGAPRALVLALKERGRRSCAGPLAAAAAQAAWRRGLAADVLTWVPARPGDLRRGFNHGEVLAEAVAAYLGLPVRPLLVPTRARRDQVGLSASARRVNLRDAFAAAGPAPARVALVDDVLTTGATASACARALRRAGARRVEIVVACRAP